MSPDFARTVCACRVCTVACQTMPGALAPYDLERIAAHLGYPDAEAFAQECLLASDGAQVVVSGGRVVSLPTLVPATDVDGQCRFLNDGRCSIHAVSPYGCAYIDGHMSEEEFQKRANFLYVALLEDQSRDGSYSRLVADLHQAGRVAPPLVDRKRRFAAAAATPPSPQPDR